VKKPLVRSVCAALAMVCPSTFVACAGGNESQSDTQHAVPSTAPKPFTSNALAAMVPKPAEFPPEVREIPPLGGEFGSGYVSNAAATKETPDPVDSSLDLARQGRTGGYERRFTTYTYIESLALARAAVDAFQTDDEAKRFLSKQFVDLQAQDGHELGSGKISVGETFVPTGLNSAVGIRYSIVFGNGEKLYYGVIGFRVGRVDGWSVVARVDQTDPTIMGSAIARTLSAQMQRALP
jgi:hypothetical protein